MEKSPTRRRLEKAASVGMVVLFAVGGIADLAAGLRTGIVTGNMGAKIHWVDSPFMFTFTMSMVAVGTLFFWFCLGAFVWDVSHSSERNRKIDAYLSSRALARRQRQDL